MASIVKKIKEKAEKIHNLKDMVRGKEPSIHHHTIDSELSLKEAAQEMVYEKLHKNEQIILKTAKVEDISKLVDVKFRFHNTEQFIHTVCVDNGKVDKDMVLVHGWAGSWVVYYRLLEALSKDYRLWCIDLLGMGGSSRPEFNVNNHTDALNFFVDSIEEWRKEVKLEKFTFVAHSLGGYVSAQYALRYPQYIERLFLISPAGVTQSPNEDALKEAMIKRRFLGKRIKKFEGWICEKKLTPSGLVQNGGTLGLHFLKHYLGRLKFENKEEREVFNACMAQSMLLPTSSEKAVFYLVLYPATFSTVPLEAEFSKEKMPYPIEFVFGDKDWMSPEGARRVSKSQNFKFYTASNSGHHCYFDNTKELYDALMGNKEPEKIEDVIEDMKEQQEEDTESSDESDLSEECLQFNTC